MSRILDSEAQLKIQAIDDKQLQETTARILAEVSAFFDSSNTIFDYQQKFKQVVITFANDDKDQLICEITSLSVAIRNGAKVLQYTMVDAEDCVKLIDQLKTMAGVIEPHAKTKAVIDEAFAATIAYRQKHGMSITDEFKEYLLAHLQDENTIIEEVTPEELEYY